MSKLADLLKRLVNIPEGIELYVYLKNDKGHLIKLWLDLAYFWVPCTTGGWNRFYMEDHPLTLKQFKYRVYRGTMIVF